MIVGREQSPTNSVSIDLFIQFTKVLVKDYVYRRMTESESILLELVLCLTQEIFSGRGTSSGDQPEPG